MDISKQKIEKIKVCLSNYIQLLIDIRKNEKEEIKFIDDVYIEDLLQYKEKAQAIFDDLIIQIKLDSIETLECKVDAMSHLLGSCLDREDIANDELGDDIRDALGIEDKEL